MSAAALQTVFQQVKTHNSIASIRAMRRALSPSVSVGFVPTMGALHDGHLSLVREARMNNDVVVASIFVNPTQFGEGEDLDKYPRQLERDSEMLEDYGVDHIFAPTNDMMYGKGHTTFVEPTGFNNIAESIQRPGHFRGVATIVTKLFNIVQPTRAYFGQKDAAQCCLIERIVDDLNMEVEVKIVDTMREHDGLAMSSRNTYLSDEERGAAPVVFAALSAARDRYQKLSAEEGSAVSSEYLAKTVESVLRSEPLVTDIQYITVDDRRTMEPVAYVEKGHGAVISLAVRIGSVRLIDNIVI